MVFIKISIAERCYF